MRELLERSLAAAMFAALVLGPSTAFAQDDEEADADASEEAEVDAKKDAPKPWRVSASVSTIVGSGTFVNVSNDTELADEVGAGDNAFDSIAASFGVSGSYKLDDFSFGLRMAVSQGLTSNNGINSPFEARFQDIGLSARWAGYKIEPIGARVSANLGLSLPTSDVSQASSRILGTRLGASLSKTFLDTVGVTLSGGVGKNFHQFTSRVVDRERVGTDNVLFRQGGSEVVDDNIIAVGGINSEWSFSAGLSANVSFTDDLSGSISYTLGQSLSYDVESRNVRDEYTSPYARTGRIGRQYVATSVDLSYSINKYFGASLGLSTSSAPLTSDNRSFRFPFYDLEGGGAGNRSAFSLGLSARY